MCGSFLDMALMEKGFTSPLLRAAEIISYQLSEKESPRPWGRWWQSVFCH